MHLLTKAVRMLGQHGSAFVLRRAIWRLHYERFQRIRSSRTAQTRRASKVIRFLDQEFELHPSGKGLNEELALFGTHEPLSTEIFLRHLFPGDHIIDIGSNIGYFLLLEARKVGSSGCLLGFEPVAEVYSVLQGNVQRSKHANIQLFPCAIGAKDETAQFYESEIPNWGSLVRDDRFLPRRSTTVQVKQLDTLLQGMPGVRPKALRMDIEGGELDVLNGAQATLREYKPCLFIEFHPFVLGWEPTRAALLGLRDLGYTSGALVERTWDQPWMSKWMRERRSWFGSMDELLRTAGSKLTDSPFCMILRAGR